jgi:CubicO group peptidase (beta-lactamase class C family)
MNRIVLLLLLCLGLSSLSAGSAFGAGLPTAKPEDVGMDGARLARIGQALRADVEKGRLPGAVVVVARKGRVAYVDAIGFRDKATNAPMTADAIFRLASMTKPMASVAAMQLYEEGRLLVSDPVSKYIPAFAARQVGVDRVPAVREMTIQDLLRHTSGLPYGSRGETPVHKLYPSGSGATRQMTATEFIDRLAQAPLLHQPGTTWEYGFSSDVLGRVVEVITGKTLGQVLDDRVFRPLKMSDTAFVVPKDKQGRIAQGLATDPDTREPVTLPDVTVAPKFECGGACAVSTAGDYVRFAQMLLNRGTLDGVRVLAPKTVEYMTADHLGTGIVNGITNPGAGYGFGLGFAVRRENGIADVAGSAGDYHWAGAFGTSFWVDPREQLVVVAMTQAPGPIRTHYRRLMRSLVLQAIVEPAGR